MYMVARLFFGNGSSPKDCATHLQTSPKMRCSSERLRNAGSVCSASLTMAYSFTFATAETPGASSQVDFLNPTDGGPYLRRHNSQLTRSYCGNRLLRSRVRVKRCGVNAI